ncbi:MAG TPA: hypothetical protein VG273_11550, partial [Bryobacteraceae bacterium]|nr:hypothetical protein [Bryobacteraceae bacterium]
SGSESVYFEFQVKSNRVAGNLVCLGSGRFQRGEGPEFLREGVCRDGSDSTGNVCWFGYLKSPCARGVLD